MMSSNLDMDKFAKVHRLMTEGATEGERSAAKTRAEAMAKRAGLTLKQAASKVDSKPKGFAYSQQPAGPTVRDIFEGFDDWMERKEPGYKAKRAAEKASAEETRQAKLRDLLRKYGSEDAIFDETLREQALRIALEPLADYSTYANAADLPPSRRQFVSGYDGWRSGNPTPAMWEAMRGAFDFPETIAGVWREYREWEAQTDERVVAFRDYSPPEHVQARQGALEHLLDTAFDPTIEGIRARLEWLSYVANLGFSRDAKKDQALAMTLRADFDELAQDVIRERTGRGYGERKPSKIRRTNADKQRDVLSILDAETGITDREIARRCGVSPQTVGNWRRRKEEA